MNSGSQGIASGTFEEINIFKKQLKLIPPYLSITLRPPAKKPIGYPQWTQPEPETRKSQKTTPAPPGSPPNHSSLFLFIATYVGPPPHSLHLSFSKSSSCQYLKWLHLSSEWQERKDLVSLVILICSAGEKQRLARKRWNSGAARVITAPFSSPSVNSLLPVSRMKGTALWDLRVQKTYWPFFFFF